METNVTESFWNDFFTYAERGANDVFNFWGKSIDLQQKQNYGNQLLYNTPYMTNVAGQTINYNIIIIIALLLIGAMILLKTL